LQKLFEELFQVTVPPSGHFPSAGGVHAVFQPPHPLSFFFPESHFVVF